MLEPIDTVLGQQEGARICEIGCASGQFSQALSARYMRKRISLFGLDIARKVLLLYPFERICGSAFAMPCASESFDMICLPATLHHLSPFTESLNELNRTIAKGGYFYCMEPNYYHPQRYFFMRHAALYQLYRSTNDVPVHPGKLTALLNELNFEIVYFRYINIYFSNPSMLQKLQNLIADTMPAAKVSRYWMPWFILMAKKH
ncbi:MAG TPA: class I SAM-dependent methyltransferase [Syntrophales bacterium]|nr:class I SAM-dependent methyltransferase [Syntrophales bacterium]